MTGQCKLQPLLLTGQKYRKETRIARLSRFRYDGVDIASVTITGSETDIAKVNDWEVQTESVEVEVDKDAAMKINLRYCRLPM